jgi:hypothetical protein
MTWVVLLAYAVGAASGLLASRSEGLARVWPRVVRAQLLVASAALSVAAAWRLTDIEQALWPMAIAAVFVLILLVALAVGSAPRRAGRATLHAWSATANTAFFVIPAAAAFGGTGSVVVAVLADRLGTPLWAVYVWLLRRDAPRPQRSRTSWIDQAPAIALLVGLLLRSVAPAPEWTATVSLWAAPVLAATGAAVFVGSVLHPSQRIDPRPGLLPWASLVALRIVLLLPIALLAPTPDVAVVAVLCAFSIPAFGPPQFSTVYGYADPVVAAGSRYGWWLGAIGVAVGAVMTR